MTFNCYRCHRRQPHHEFDGYVAVVDEHVYYVCRTCRESGEFCLNCNKYRHGRECCDNPSSSWWVKFVQMKSWQ